MPAKPFPVKVLLTWGGIQFRRKIVNNNYFVYRHEVKIKGKAAPIASAKVTIKGQITIPKEVREKLGIKKGDVVFFFAKDGYVMMTKEVSLP